MIDPLKLPQPNDKKKMSWYPLVLLGIGLMLIIGQLFLNLGNYVSTWFLFVQHPTSYEFKQLDYILKHYVHEDKYYSWVDYTQLKRSKELSEAVSELSRIAPDHLDTPAKRIVFWVNAYNLVVLDSIVSRYPLKSIENQLGIFSLHKYLVGGKPLSVDNILEFELTPLCKQDYRVLFLCCDGSVGSPPIPTHAIAAENLEKELHAATFKFINNPANVCFDTTTSTFYLSPFFRLNADLWENSDVHAFVNSLFPANQQLDLSDFHIKTAYFPSFNWLLNDLALKEVTTIKAGAP